MIPEPIAPRRWTFSWAWPIGVVLIPFLFGGSSNCPGPTPTPTPTPDPSARPTSPVYTDLLLRQSEGKLSRQIVGAIPCWPTCDEGCLNVDGKKVPYMWPLTSSEWMDATKPKGVNAYHVRLGPSTKATQCCGLQSIGGPYLDNVPPPALTLHHRQPHEQAPANLPKLAAGPRASFPWNPAYWAYLHQVLYHAGDIGATVEVDVLDGWLIKHTIWGDASMPWPSQDILNATTLPLNSSIVEWVQKVTFETCNYGNIVYQVSNESPGIPGWAPAWEQAMLAAIRAGERQAGCSTSGAPNVVHMVGSNSQDTGGAYDYFTIHDGDPGIQAGRPLLENEWNPHVSAATFYAQCQSSLAANGGCWYWRSDGADADQDASLDAIKGGVTYSCPAPQPDSTRLGFAFNCDASNNCDTTPLSENYLPYCQSIGMGTYSGQPRATCPMRNECGPSGEIPADQDPANPGPSFQCSHRLQCEQFAMQAPSPVFTSDGNWRYVDAGHFRVKVDGGTWLQACNAAGTQCSRTSLH